MTDSPAAPRPRTADEAGFAGGAEALIFGLLLFVVGTLLVANAWNVVDTKTAAVAAAREAARSYVEATNANDAQNAAQAAARQALAGYRRDPTPARLTVTGGAFGRCQRITVQVVYPVPFVVLPFVGHLGSAGTVKAAHSELVDPYRSGLPGSSSCG